MQWLCVEALADPRLSETYRAMHQVKAFSHDWPLKCFDVCVVIK